MSVNQVEHSFRFNFSFRRWVQSVIARHINTPDYVRLDRKYLTTEDEELNRSFYSDSMTAFLYALTRAWTKETEDSIKENLLSRVLDHLNPGDLVLIIGTGTAKDQKLLQERGHDCIGIDLSHAMLTAGKKQFSRDNSEDRFVQGTAFELPFSEDSFDFVYMDSAAEHMDQVQLSRVLNEIRRVLKPSSEREAHLLINVRNRDGKVYRINDQINGTRRPKVFATYELEGFNRILRQSGFLDHEQWQAWGGTPNVSNDFPWLNTLARMVED